MSRLKIDQAIEVTGDEFAQVVDSYCTKNGQLKILKNDVDELNAAIKETMADKGLNEYDTGNNRITVSESDRVTTDEDKLLAVVKAYGIDAVRTREYVDTDALEDYLYKNTVSAELRAALDACMEHKKVVTLRTSKTRKGA